MADSERRLLNKLPNEVKNVDDMCRVKKEFENKITNIRPGFFNGFRKWNYKRQANKFKRSEVNALCKGAHGENDVIEEMLKLDDSHHILCGVDIELPYYVTYNEKKNLKSASMDLVVVCPKGVYIIEVKNWSNRFAKSDNKIFSPYEQTERAGRVLWISLQGIFRKVRVTNVLLSIKGNLEYNKNYRSVFVTSLDKINFFLMRRQDALTENQIKNIVKDLKGHGTI